MCSTGTLAEKSSSFWPTTKLEVFWQKIGNASHRLRTHLRMASANDRGEWIDTRPMAVP